MTELQASPRVFALSRRDQGRDTVAVRGVLDLRRVSSSSELKSFLLNMCVDAPESTTNSRSSGMFEMGAGIGLASKRDSTYVYPYF